MVFALPLLMSVMLAQEPSSSRMNENTDFHFVCKVGGKQASITREAGLLTYRFGTPRRPQLTIRQSLSGQMSSIEMTLGLTLGATSCGLLEDCIATA